MKGMMILMIMVVVGGCATLPKGEGECVPVMETKSDVEIRFRGDGSIKEICTNTYWRDGLYLEEVETSCVEMNVSGEIVVFGPTTMSCCLPNGDTPRIRMLKEKK